MKRHLRRHLFQCSHLEVRGTHPRFDSAVGMRDGHAADRQLGWVFVQAFLHSIENILLFPATHSAVFARRAFWFENAPGAQA